MCLVCVFSVAIFLPACNSNPNMVTDQDITELYNDNKELFDRTAKEVEKLEKKLKEIEGLSFRYEEHRVVAYSINTPISFDFPDDLHSDLLDCFIAMDSIVNEVYDDNEYVLAISYTAVGLDADERNVTEFMFANDVVRRVSALTYSEAEPAEPNITINENWYITWWGGV